MKRFIHMASLVGPLMILLTANVGRAQTGGGYDLGWNMISGHEQTSTAVDYEVVGSIGQPAVGTLSGADYIVEVGFWAGVSAGPSAPPCVGDCGGDRAVDVTETIKMITIALGSSPAADCRAGDANNDNTIDVTEIIRGVNHALHGCGG